MPDKRVIVFGIGGVGGYFGGKLCGQGLYVTFVARGAHAAAIRNSGLSVESIHGDFRAVPNQVCENLEAAGPADLLLLCCKGWQLPEVLEQLRAIKEKNMYILPMLNGVDAIGELETVWPPERILGGFCKIVSKLDGPGKISHFAFDPVLYLGARSAGQEAIVHDWEMLFTRSGFRTVVAKDILMEMWKKFLFIAPFSALGALCRRPLGALAESPGWLEMLEEATREVALIGRAEGIDISEELIRVTLDMVRKQQPDTTASMQRDVMEGRPSEMPNFQGYLVRKAREHHLEVPFTEKLYALLLPQETEARRKYGMTLNVM